MLELYRNKFGESCVVEKGSSLVEILNEKGYEKIDENYFVAKDMELILTFMRLKGDMKAHHVIEYHDLIHSDKYQDATEYQKIQYLKDFSNLKVEVA